MDNIGGYILLDHKILQKIQSSDLSNPTVLTENEFDAIYSKLIAGKELQIILEDDTISPVGSYKIDVLSNFTQSATLEFNVSYGYGGVQLKQYGIGKLVQTIDDETVVTCVGVVQNHYTTVPLADPNDAGMAIIVNSNGNYELGNVGGGGESYDFDFIYTGKTFGTSTSAVTVLKTTTLNDIKAKIDAGKNFTGRVTQYFKGTINPGDEAQTIYCRPCTICNFEHVTNSNTFKLVFLTWGGGSSYTLKTFIMNADGSIASIS